MSGIPAISRVRLTSPAHPWATILREARVNAKLRQIDLVDKIGYATNSVQVWETGQVQPSLFNFIAWANALGYDVRLEKIK